MIKSMTGFGQAVGGKSPFRWAVELRSWNHRFFECSTRLPNMLSALDEKIREFVHGHVQRGKISVSIALRSKQVDSNGLILDERRIDSYFKALRRIRKKYGLREPIGLNALLSVPNLFTVDHREYSPEHYWAGLKHVLDHAVEQLVRAKVREGTVLKGDMRKRLTLITACLNRIEHHAKAFPAHFRKRLMERVKDLTEGVVVDSGRLEQEIAFQAERSDITEELVRARHHLEFMRKSLDGSGEVGKKLDFIAQEIHREVNTIASKAQDFQIAEDVVLIKSELEKIREQVQNIE